MALLPKGKGEHQEEGPQEREPLQRNVRKGWE